MSSAQRAEHMRFVRGMADPMLDQLPVAPLPHHETQDRLPPGAPRFTRSAPSSIHQGVDARSLGWSLSAHERRGLFLSALRRRPDERDRPMDPVVVDGQTMQPLEMLAGRFVGENGRRLGDHGRRIGAHAVDHAQEFIQSPDPAVTDGTEGRPLSDPDRTEEQEQRRELEPLALQRSRAELPSSIAMPLLAQPLPQVRFRLLQDVSHQLAVHAQEHGAQGLLLSSGRFVHAQPGQKGLKSLHDSVPVPVEDLRHQLAKRSVVHRYPPPLRSGRPHRAAPPAQVIGKGRIPLPPCQIQRAQPSGQICVTSKREDPQERDAPSTTCAAIDAWACAALPRQFGSRCGRYPSRLVRSEAHMGLGSAERR